MTKVVVLIYPVRMYLKEMGTVELLSREGEIAIAKRIEAGKELMIGGLYENPIAMSQFLQWRDNVDNGTMMLRDIIDLETTYGRLNEEAMINSNPIAGIDLNKPIELNKSNLPISEMIDNVDKSSTISNKDDKSEQERENEDHQDDEDDQDEGETNLSIVAMESEIKGSILEMIDEVVEVFKQIETLNDRRISRLQKR